MGSEKVLDREILQHLPQLNVRQKKTVLPVVRTFSKEQKNGWDEIGKSQTSFGSL